MITRFNIVRGCVPLLAVLLATGACTPGISAQVHHGATRPSAQECRVLANKLGSNPRSEAFRQALRSNVAACGSIGAEAIATAVRAAKSVQEPGFADSFRFMVAYNRSPVVLEALLAVAEDRAAAPSMRIVAIEGAMRQHSLESGFGEGPDAVAARPMGRLCRIVLIEHAGEYRSEAAFPPDFVRVTASRLQRVADDAGNPQAIRDAARCSVERGLAR